MYKFDSKLWNFRVRKTLILALAVPLLSVMPQAQKAYAAEFKASDNYCVQDITGSTDVTVVHDGNSCVVIFKATTGNASTSYTWKVPSTTSSVSILVVAGGGSGALRHNAGGGAGGYIYQTNVGVTPSANVSIAVGKGGNAIAATTDSYSGPAGIPGVASSFAATSAAGGGGGGGLDGGSGGGACCAVAAGFGNRPSLSPSQGNNGGTGTRGSTENNFSGGGGGGAGTSGGSSTSTSSINGVGDYSTSGTVTGGAGGDGISNSITGTAACYAAGGGGGVAASGTDGGAGGKCGSVTSGGRGGKGYTNSAALQGSDGTGSGGGGGGFEGSNNGASGRGGSGIVVVRYNLPTVTISANEGTGAASATSLNVNASGQVTLPTQNTLARAGYAFGGWNTAANGTGTKYAAGASYSPPSDVTLYAQWNSFIQYNPNTATSTRSIESTTALSSAANTTLSNGKLAKGQPIASGLTLNLDAADASSVTANSWLDKSGSATNAAFVGSPTYDPVDGSFRLSGSGQYFNLGTSALTYTGTQKFSLNIMFKSDKPFAYSCLICRYANGTGGRSFMLISDQQKITVHREVSPWSIRSTSMYDPGQINYATFVYNGTNMIAYLNGTEIARQASGNETAGTIETFIGAGKSSGSALDFFAGKIYSVQAYNRDLSPTEINQNYQALLPNPTASKTNFTLIPWNTNSGGTGTSYGTTASDLAALPTPYARLLPGNFTSSGSSGTWSTPVSGTWNSTAGNNLAVGVRGAPTYNANSGGNWGAAASFPTLSGSTTDGILLNNPTLTAFTMCAVVRYKNGASAVQKRIIAGKTQNWLSGFAYSTKKFHHEAWNHESTYVVDFNWHYYCETGNSASWDGSKLPWTLRANTTLPPIGINFEYYNSENSDWELADLIIYDQHLSDSQVEQVNRFLKNTYGLIDGATAAASAVNVVPSTNYASSGDATLFANWGTAVTYEGNRQTSGKAPAPTVISGVSGALATNSGSLAKAGWRFDGWNTAADGTGTNYAAGASYPNSGNVILYAKWSLPTVFPTAVSYIEPNNLSPYMRFKASDYDATNKVWRDSSGNSRNTSLIGGTPTVVTASAGNGSSKAFQVVQGNTSANIRFGNPQWDGSRYTLFTVARYSGATQRRMFDGVGTNWLHGFFGGLSGVAHHNGWVTQYATSTHSTNWVLGTSYAYNYRSNGTSRGTSGGDASFYPLAINYERSAETSDFQVAEVLIFDRQLTLAEIQKVEDYLATTYGLNPPATTTNGYTQVGTYSTTSILNVAAGVGGRTDTFTAINGLGNKTFTMSPVVNGITIDTATANGVAVNVSGLVPAGIYVETITATDQSGATSIHVLTINASSPIKWSTSNPTSIATTVGTARNVRLDVTGGTTGKVATLAKAGTLPLPGISIDTSLLGTSAYVTLNIGTNVLPGTHTLTLNITDATGLKSNQIVTVTVNKLPALAFTNGVSDTSTTIIQSGLWLQYEFGASYSGSGAAVRDLAGNNTAGSISSGTPYSPTFGGGSVSLNGTRHIWANLGVISASTSLSKFYWIYPTASTGTIVTVCQVGCNPYHESEFELQNGKLYARVWNLAVLSTVDTITINEWHYVGYIYDTAGNSYIYVDGKLAASRANSGTRAPPPDVTQYDGISLGDGTNMGTSANGQFSLGSMHYYKRALTAAEVFSNYAATAPRFLGTAFPGLSVSGSATIATTQGVASSHSLFTATNGTGGKVITLSPTTSGITLDTSTANSAILNIDNTLTATNTTTQKVIQVSVVATDSVTAATTYPLAIQVNPPISLVPTTANSISTTFGLPAYDTFTAAYGTGTLTFTNVASAYQSAFVLTKPSANVGLLTIAGNLPAGTYTDTLTVTDVAGAVARHVLTVVVNPGMTLTGATSSSVSTTIGRSTSLRVNIANGTGSRTVTMSSTNAGITLNATTIASGYVTLNVSTNVPANTYSITLLARDSIGSASSGVFTVVVNKGPKISGPLVVTEGLALNFDAANAASYPGTGTTWNSTVGGRSVTLLGTSGLPSYSSDSGGLIDFNPTNLATQKHYAAGSIANTTFTSYTVEAWAKFAVLPTGEINGIVSDKYQTKINYELFYGSLNTENCGGAAGLHISHFDGSWRCSKAVTGIATNTWYHIVGTYDSALGFRMYLNGVLQSGASVDRTGNALSDASSREIYIGKGHDANDQFFPGSIPVVRVYNRALSATEALQNYTAIAHRYVNAASGNESVTVTSGREASVTGVIAVEGTGAKTFAKTSNDAGVTLDTSIANQYTLNFSNAIQATNATTARIFYETVTATDSVTAATTMVYKITVNPPVQLSVTTNTLATTSGIAAYDTFTATFGTGNKTFALTGTPTTSGFTLTQANNVAVIKVEPTVNPGTYYETVTATDSVGATKAISIVVYVYPAPTIIGPTSTGMTNGISFKSPIFTVLGGAPSFTISRSGTLNVSFVQVETITSTTFRLNFFASTPQGTYFETLTVTDGKGAKSAIVMTLQVNGAVTISGPQTINTTYGLSSTTVYQSTAGTAGATGYVLGGTSICATNKLTNGLYTIEEFRFSASCNWTVPAGVTAMDAIVVAGGGGGGFGSLGGGGGAGQVLVTSSPLTVTPSSSYSVTVGGGGTSGNGTSSEWNFGGNGGFSSFGSFSAVGGGGGAGNNRGAGATGGSGGGGAGYTGGSVAGGGGASQKNTYAGWLPYGNSGAAGLWVVDGPNNAGGGGGGAMSQGVTPTTSSARGNGGTGITISSFKNGSYNLGGGGGGWQGGLGATSFGGGNAVGGSYTCADDSCAGVVNTGGGGGAGAAGGSGFVAVKYLTPLEITTDTITVEVINYTSSPAKFAIRIPEFTKAGTIIETLRIRDSQGTSFSYAITINIEKATPTVALSLPGLVTTAKYGSPVSISAVASTPGKVAFKSGATTISGCESVTATSGVASCTWTPTALGSATIKATLTPTDATNYNNSTEASFSINVLKADTLTVTASNEVFTYTESAALVTKAFTFSNLVSIDTLTAVAMIYSGTANDLSSYNSSTAPTKAGTYTITPDTSTAGLSTVLANYVGATLVSGTLTINRKAPTITFTYPDSNTVAYSPSGTFAASSTSRSGTGSRSYSTMSSTKCSVDSSTALVSILEAGSCLVTMTLDQDANFLAATQDRTVVINKAPRTISLTSPVSTLKYADTATVTTTLSGGQLDGAITYSLNSTPGCDFDALGGILTATSGTLACTLNATVGDGTNYLTASTSAALALTIAKANAPVITIDTVTAVDYVPGQSASIAPTYTISGLKGLDAGTVTLNYTIISSAAGFSFSYSSTSIPSDAGTYGITPSALTMSTGLATNYETPNYASSLIQFTINRIAQAPVTIDNVNGEVDVPFKMFARGGSTNGALSFTKISGENCLNPVGNELNATSAGTCVVTVTMAENRNYLAVTSDSVTVIVRKFILAPVFIFGGGGGITIASATTLTKGAISCLSGCVPTITSAAPYEGAEGDVITLTGTNFTGATRVVFNVFTNAIVFSADSDTQITVQIPAGLNPGDATIDVMTPGKTSPRFWDFYVLP